MGWSIAGNKIALDAGREVSFEYDVKEVVEAGSVFLVVLDVPTEAVMTENVFGISSDGRKLWQVEWTASTGTDPANIYVGVLWREGGVARIANWNGVLVDVDVHTGKVLDQRFGK